MFKASVALDDGATPLGQAVVFGVWGDNRVLWQSERIRKPKEVQECRIDIRGVDVLELRVFAEGSHFGLHAVWIEPRLLEKADTPDE